MTDRAQNGNPTIRWAARAVRAVLVGVVVFTALVVNPSLGKKPKGNAGPPAILDQVTAMGVSDRSRAVALIEDYLDDRHAPGEMAWALVWAGEQRRLAGDDPAAMKWFRQLLEDYPTDRRKQGAVLGIALIDAKVALSGNTLATLSMVGDEEIPSSMNADRYRLLARVAADDGSPPNRVAELVAKATRYAAGDPTVEARVQHTLADLMVVAAPADAPPLLPTDPGAAITEARVALDAQDYVRAKELALVVQTTWPDDAKAQTTAQYVIRLAEAETPVDGDKVAVLLPLSGDWAATGTRIKDVIEMANANMGQPMELVFVDTQGKPEVALSKLEELVITGGAVAVLGPLLKDEALALAEPAQALAVPMISLSQNKEVTAAGSYVFRGFLSVEEQVDALLDEAMKTRGMDRFAILYPLTPYGQAARDLFAAGAQSRGGSIARAIGYAEDSTDFLKVARDLGQKDDPARAAEWSRVRSAARREGEELHKVTIAPLLDFDAIFIPDNHRRVPLVASALAYEEFPVGAFRPHREDQPVVLLGLNAWNQETFPRDGGKYVQNCLFVDAFRAQSDDPSVKAFVSSYQSTFRRGPLVVDAVTYDAARLVAAAVKKAGNSRAEVQQALTEVKLDNAVSGGTMFGEDRGVARRLQVLTVSDDQIQAALPPGLEQVEPAGE